MRDWLRFIILYLVLLGLLAFVAYWDYTVRRATSE